jgi:ferredoxin
MMRIVVDLNRCLGYAQCVFLSPDTFTLNGEEALMYDPNPDEAKRLRVLRAAAACPVQAIAIDRLESAQAAGGGAKRERDSGEVAAASESVVRDFLPSPDGGAAS